MAGHMGAVRVTTQNLEVVSIDEENDLILVHGAVPGSKNGWVHNLPCEPTEARASGRRFAFLATSATSLRPSSSESSPLNSNSS